MGLFGEKKKCVVCENNLGLVKNKTLEGHICPNCFTKLNPSYISKLKSLSNDEIRNILKSVVENKELVNQFNCTKKIGTQLEIDEEKKQWLIPDGIFGGKKNPNIYNFSDILEVELLEDGDTITKGGLGSAIAGGLLFGGVGAVVGGITGSKKTKSFINTLKIKITLNSISNPIKYIDLIKSKTDTKSFIYKTNYEIAQQILSVFSIMINSNLEGKNTTGDNNDENFIFCRKCGTKLPNDSSFCNKCGNQLD